MSTTNSFLPIRPDEYIHVPNVHCLHGECPCARSQRCDIWMEYQIAMVSLHDSGELSRGNWREITRLRNYICYLEGILGDYQISHGDEFGIFDNSTQDCNRLP